MKPCTDPMHAGQDIKGFNHQSAPNSSNDFLIGQSIIPSSKIANIPHIHIDPIISN